VQAHNMKADGLFAKGMYNESYDEYFKAKKLAKDNLDNCSLSKYTHSLGMALYKQERFVDAASQFKESLKESAECPNKFIFFYHKQELLDNIGLCYYKANMYDSALVYYGKALAFIDSNYMRHGKNAATYISARAVVYGNLADIYIVQKKYDTAERLLKKSIATNLQKGYTNNDAIITQVKLADLYSKSGKMDTMKELLGYIKAELDSIPDKQVEQYWNKLMWRYYDSKKDSLQAYKYLFTYQTLKDSIQAGQKALVSSDIIGRIRNLERQYQIAELNKYNQRKKLYLIAAGIIGMMAIAILLLILKNARKSKENIKALTRLNNQVNEQKSKAELALAELKARDKDKSRILRSVAHDIMSPISAIIALNDIMSMDADQFNEDQQEIIRLIKDACNNSLSLSRDILEASNEIDPAEMSREWEDICKLVHKSVELQKVRAQNKNQTINISCGASMQAYVNKEKMWRVMSNLLSNAIKFSHENATIDITVEKKETNIHIAIIDKGIGIPDRYKPYVFDMFSEAKVHGTNGEVPHGIGLSICLQIVKAHKGTIWFDSEEGKGSTFHVEIPIAAEVKKSNMHSELVSAH
jgi:signal transduction histidine kinase